ncbi:MAG TPA: phosphohistidine phosphatase SixA [Burkholderiales bacterium]|nr:phosphohistidine phosphatase SixA [Burkholderiales bacterium]
MNLILWRHADAEDGTPDIKRRLTEKGKRQARLMAEWLRGHLPDNVRVLVSPAVRARQTADALGMDYSILDEVAPDVAPSTLLAAAGWPTAGDSVLVVGHQPTLGMAASQLIVGDESLLNMKKGAIVWIVREEGSEGATNVLKAAMSPEML